VVCFGGLWPGYVSQAHHAVAPPGFGHPFLGPGDLKKGHLYSYVMNNNFRTNFQAVQVADVLFRYSLTSDAGDGEDRQSCAFGWGCGTPLETACVRGPQAGTQAPRQQLCRIEADEDNALLLTLKQAENGAGVTAPVLEMAGKAGNAVLHLPFYDIAHAMETNLVEEERGMLPSGRHTVMVPLRPRGITTVRCYPAAPILPG
jgi:hypothetical protein